MRAWSWFGALFAVLSSLLGSACGGQTVSGAEVVAELAAQGTAAFVSVGEHLDIPDAPVRRVTGEIDFVAVHSVGEGGDWGLTYADGDRVLVGKGDDPHDVVWSRAVGVATLSSPTEWSPFWLLDAIAAVDLEIVRTAEDVTRAEATLSALDLLVDGAVAELHDEAAMQDRVEELLADVPVRVSIAVDGQGRLIEASMLVDGSDTLMALSGRARDRGLLAGLLGRGAADNRLLRRLTFDDFGRAVDIPEVGEVNNRMGFGIGMTG